MTKKEESKQKENRAEKRLIYAGPNINNLLLTFGKVYKEVPKIPKEYKQFELENFFVEIKEYPKKKDELLKKAEIVKRKMRAR